MSGLRVPRAILILTAATLAAALATPPAAHAQRRGRGGRASLTLAEKQISVIFTPLAAEDSGAYAGLEALKPGGLLLLKEASALRFTTNADLAFGKTVVKTANHAPDYPGRYSMWLKRGLDGWRLVFNERVDIWGTQHDAKADVAEIPLAHKTLEEPASRLTIELKEAGERAGTLRLAWGAHEWTAKFELAIPPRAK